MVSGEATLSFICLVAIVFVNLQVGKSDRIAGACCPDLSPIARFLYGGTYEPYLITTDATTALSHLCDSALYDTIDDFLIEDLNLNMNLNTISTYYEHAHIFGDEAILDRIMIKL